MHYKKEVFEIFKYLKFFRIPKNHSYILCILFCLNGDILFEKRQHLKLYATGEYE